MLISSFLQKKVIHTYIPYYLAKVWKAKPKYAVKYVKGLPHLCPCNQPTKNED